LLLPELELELLPVVLELLLLELLQMPLLHHQGSLGKPSAWHWRWVLAKFILSVRKTSTTISTTFQTKPPLTF
jgi:hypothetical protein